MKAVRRSKTTDTAGGIGDAAVLDATGKSWKAWFALLDRAGAKKMGHKEIVAVVHERFGVGPWWRQMITVAYEQERGLRKKHERPDGYQIGRSKTIAAPVAQLFNAWTDPSLRKLWLHDRLVIRKATPGKSLRITWPNDRTSVEVNFYSKGNTKTQVTVQHGKLPDAQSAENMKAYWTSALGRLEIAFSQQMR